MSGGAATCVMAGTGDAANAMAEAGDAASAMAEAGEATTFVAWARPEGEGGGGEDGESGQSARYILTSDHNSACGWPLVAKPVVRLAAHPPSRATHQ